MKRFLKLALALALMLNTITVVETTTNTEVLSVSASAASYERGKYKVWHEDGVIVRSSYSTSSSKVGAASKGTTFTVTKIKTNGGYTWGYTNSIKICGSNRTAGWVALKFAEFQDEQTVSITANTSFPNKLKLGKGCHLEGTLTSSGAEIDSVTATIRDSNGNKVFSKTVTPNSGTYTYKLRDSALDWGVPFSTITSTGEYTLVYTVKAGGKTKTVNHCFTVYDDAPSSDQAISAKTIYINQYDFASRSACTLASAGMMLRAKACLDGKSASSVTMSELWQKGWCNGAGTYLNFSIDGMRVNAINIESSNGLNCQNDVAKKTKMLKMLLDQHQEGVTIYCYDNCGRQHAVYLSHYDENGVFYILDPAAGNAKYIPLSESVNPISTKVANIKQIWYIGSLGVTKF